MDPVMTISPSQLSRWDSCESAWNFNYRLGYVPHYDKPYMSVGTFSHRFLQIYYECRREGIRDRNEIWQKIIDYANSMFEKSPEFTADEITAWNRSLRIVRRYINEYAPKNDGFRILDVERHFEAPLVTPKGLPYILQGYIDLLVELEGRMYLWDHKTVGQSKFWTSDQTMLDPQMTLYTLGMRELGYDIFGTIINQLNTYDYKDFDSQPLEKLYRREKTYRTDTQVTNMGYHLGLAVDEIAEKGDSGIYRKSLRRGCDKCVYREPCLYELKGIDPSGILESDLFRRRDSQRVTEPAPEQASPEGLEYDAFSF